MTKIIDFLQQELFYYEGYLKLMLLNSKSTKK
ncbi:hypothetical protein ES703_104042 [subsurface metagenome]